MYRIAVSRHDLTHQLLYLSVGHIVSRFPGVPTILLAGFLYCKEGLLNVGYSFFFIGRSPLGRGRENLARFARLTLV